MNRPSRCAYLSFWLIILAHFTVGCDDNEERYEVINKLRALGVESNPLVGTPSTDAKAESMQLTFYAAVPLGADITAEAFLDSGSRYAPPIALAINQSSASYKDLASFRLYQIVATLSTPTLEDAPILPSKGFATLRYGLILTSGSEVEKIVGNVLVYPEGAPQHDWKAPSAEVVAPEQDATISGDQDLTATIDNTIEDNWRIGWFVGDGKVKSRRSDATKWETSGSGPQTVIFTARGLKSGAFLMRAVDVIVE